MQRATPAQAVTRGEHNRQTQRQISSRRQNFEYSVKPCVAERAEFHRFRRRLAVEPADFPLERRVNVEDRSGGREKHGPDGRQAATREAQLVHVIYLMVFMIRI